MGDSCSEVLIDIRTKPRPGSGCGWVQPAALPKPDPGLLTLCALFFPSTLELSGEDETTPIANIEATCDGCSREAKIGAKQSQTKGKENFWH